MSVGGKKLEVDVRERKNRESREKAKASVDRVCTRTRKLLQDPVEVLLQLAVGGHEQRKAVPGWADERVGVGLERELSCRSSTSSCCKKTEVG